MVSFSVSCGGLIRGTGVVNSGRRDACNAGRGGKVLPLLCWFGGQGKGGQWEPQNLKGAICSLGSDLTTWGLLGPPWPWSESSGLGEGGWNGWSHLAPCPPFSLLASSVTSKWDTAGTRTLKGDKKTDVVWSPVNETVLPWPLHLAYFVVSPGIPSTFKWENNNCSSQVDWEQLSWHEAHTCIPREQAASWGALQFCEVSLKSCGLVSSEETHPPATRTFPWKRSDGLKLMWNSSDRVWSNRKDV